MDWIQGYRFIDLANFTYAPLIRRNDDYNQLPNTLDINKIKDRNIVYTHTMYAKQLFEVIADLPQMFIVITHNSDVNIDFLPPVNVIKWFSQNVSIVHDKIESLPIGLENDIWFRDIRKKEKMMAKMRGPRKYKNLVYMNHNIATNPTDRIVPYRILKDKPWVTTDMRANGQDFDNYLDNIYNHRFVICPVGNGCDTHRIWECLYMGTIPIVEDNINNSFYFDLPMLRLDAWINVTEELLNSTWDELQDIKWNKEMLTFEYWKNKILNTNWIG